MKLTAVVFLGLLGLPALAGNITPHFFNSGVNNRDLTLAPDGRTALSTIMAPANQFAVIIMSTRVDGEWTPPVIAPFSGTSGDIEPMYSPDGSKLYFSSRRPKPGRDGDDWDIWSVTVKHGTFGEPVNVGAPVNTAADEFYPSIASNGNLYFTAEREGGVGGEDIFRAIARDGRFTHVEHVGNGVNTEGYEFNAFVAPDESYLIFSSQGRADDLGRGDLYISQRGADGAFKAATHLPEPINSPMLDYCPYVFKGTLYFSSRRFEKPGAIADYQTAIRIFGGVGNGLGDIYSVPFTTAVP